MWESGEIAASPVGCLLFFCRFTTKDANISKQKDKWRYQSLLLKSVPKKLWRVTCLENRSRKERMPPAAAWSDDGRYTAEILQCVKGLVIQLSECMIWWVSLDQSKLDLSLKSQWTKMDLFNLPLNGQILPSCKWETPDNALTHSGHQGTMSALVLTIAHDQFCPLHSRGMQCHFVLSSFG